MIRDFKLSPPGQWRYTQPETNHTMIGITFHALIRKVAQHRQNNNIPFDEDLAIEVENWICEHMEPQDRNEYCAEGKRVPTSIGWQEVSRFLKTMGAFFVQGGQCVDQAEADRRAAICADCPFQVSVHGCGICRATVDEFRASIMKRTTPSDPKL